MYVILCYDVGSKRQAAVRKTTKKYLYPVQKSVFEGVLTEGALHKLEAEIKRLVDPEHDAISIYCCRSPSVVDKVQLGLVSEADSTFM